MNQLSQKLINLTHFEIHEFNLKLTILIIRLKNL